MRDYKDATDLVLGGGGDMSEPIMMSDRKGHNGITQDGTATTLTAQEKERPIVEIGGISNGMDEATARNPMLRVLRETYGAEDLVKWALGVLDALQQAEVLRQGVHESGVSGEAKNGGKLDDGSLPCPSVVAGWLLRDVRVEQERGCTSQGRESEEQRFEQSPAPLPELPYESSQAAAALFDLWESGEGLGLLQQALHQIQEVWKSSLGERARGGGAMKSVVRRLTPLE